MEGTLNPTTSTWLRIANCSLGSLGLQNSMLITSLWSRFCSCGFLAGSIRLLGFRASGFRDLGVWCLGLGFGGFGV